MVKIIQQKFRKYHKVRVDSYVQDQKRLSLLYGVYGLKVLQATRLTSNELESIRRVLKRYLKKSGVIWLRVLPDRGITSKPAEVRMGKGKGSYSESISVVLRGSVIVEIGGPNIQRKVALLALKYAQEKLSVPSKIIVYKG